MKEKLLKTFQACLMAIALTIATLMQPASAANGGSTLCADGGLITNPSNNHQYCLVAKGTWQNAQRAAQAVGGSLVTVNDQAEQDWLFETFGGEDLWIGLTDRAVEGLFLWEINLPKVVERVSYTNWSFGEPNNGGVRESFHAWAGTSNPAGGEDYVAMLPSERGKWHDLRASTSLRGIAELSNIIPPNIINLDARQNNQGNPVMKSLSAGTYRVHVLGTADGGQFDAWNDVDFERGCDGNGQNCNNGWETRYYFKPPYNKVTDSSCSKKKFGACRYETAAQAAANAPGDVTFTLSGDTEVKFYIYDSKGLDNNQGGVSLQIIQQ